MSINEDAQNQGKLYLFLYDIYYCLYFEACENIQKTDMK